MTTESKYRRHAMNRSNERYGLELTRAEYAAISVQIAFHALTGETNYVRLSHAGETANAGPRGSRGNGCPSSSTPWSPAW